MLDERLLAKLEEARRRPIQTEEDAEIAEGATRLLRELVALRDRARRLVESEQPTGESLAGLTLHEAARRVLEEVGRPVHARELGARIKARGWTHPRSEHAHPDQIVFQLAARLPKHPKTFRRVAPNTFALAKWGDARGGARRRPRLPLFRGPGGSIARDSADLDPEPDSWRSS